MEFLHILTDYLAASPWLAAIILGLLTGLNPCQLAINVSAITYLDASYRRGVVYLAGRALTYLLLGWGGSVLLSLLTDMTADIGSRCSGVKYHLSVFNFQFSILSFFEAAIYLLASGFFLYRFLHIRHHDGSCHNSRSYIRRDGHRGALLLGAMLALLFCPESAVLFFGMLLPLGATSSLNTALVPPLFTLAAQLPLFLLLVFLHSTSVTLQRYERLTTVVQQTCNILLALLFLIQAIVVFL